MAYRVKAKDENGAERNVVINGKEVLGFDVSPDLVEIKEVDEENRSFLATAASEAPDRIYDIIRIAGIDLTDYEKNPVVMWAHEYRALPLGISLETIKRPRKKVLEFRPNFDDHEFAEKVYRSYLKKIMRGFSVGLLPIEMEKRQDMTEEEKAQAGYFGGWEIKKSSLLEISCAPIPMHQDALAQMKAVGFPMELLSPADLGFGNKEKALDDGSYWVPVEDTMLFFNHKTIPLDDKVNAIVADPLGASGSGRNLSKVVGYLFSKDMSEEERAEWLSSFGVSDRNVMIVASDTNVLELSAEEIGLVKGICGSSSLPLSDKSSWDGDAARKRMWEKGLSTFKKGHVWQKPDENPETKGAYSLPFADIIDGTLTAVWGGVRAAMAAVHGARNAPEGDRRKQHNFLAKYYRRFGKEPPEFKTYTDEELHEIFGIDTSDIDKQNSTDGDHQGTANDMEPIVNVVREELTELFNTFKEEVVTAIRASLEETSASSREPNITQGADEGDATFVQAVGELVAKLKEDKDTPVIPDDLSQEDIVKLSEMVAQSLGATLGDAIASTVEENLKSYAGIIDD